MKILGLLRDRNRAMVLKDDIAALLDEIHVRRDCHSPYPQIDTQLDSFRFMPITPETTRNLCGQQADYILMDRETFLSCIRDTNFALDVGCCLEAN